MQGGENVLPGGWKLLSRGEMTLRLVWTSVVLREFNIVVESLWREVWLIMIES